MRKVSAVIRFIHAAILITTFVVIGSCQTKGVEETTSAVASCGNLKTDLADIHLNLTNNFSGYVYDPRIKSLEEKTFHELMKEADKCRNMLDYAKTVRSYFAVFRDPHLSISQIKGIEPLVTGLVLRKLNERNCFGKANSSKEDRLATPLSLNCFCV